MNTAQALRNAAENLAQSFTEHRNTRHGDDQHAADYWKEAYEIDHMKYAQLKAIDPRIDDSRLWRVFGLAEARYWQITKPAQHASVNAILMPWRKE